jgi:hypothetical protein
LFKRKGPNQGNEQQPSNHDTDGKKDALPPLANWQREFRPRLAPTF